MLLFSATRSSSARRIRRHRDVSTRQTEIRGACIRPQHALISIDITRFDSDDGPFFAVGCSSAAKMLEDTKSYLKADRNAGSGLCRESLINTELSRAFRCQQKEGSEASVLDWTVLDG